MFKFQIGPGLNHKWNTEDKKIHYPVVYAYLICISSPKKFQTIKVTVKSTQSGER